MEKYWRDRVSKDGEWKKKREEDADDHRSDRDGTTRLERQRLERQERKGKEKDWTDNNSWDDWGKKDWKQPAEDWKRPGEDWKEDWGEGGWKEKGWQGDVRRAEDRAGDDAPPPPPPPPPDDVQVATPAAGIGAPAVGLGAQSATWVQAGGLAGATPKAPPGVAPPQVVLPPWKGQRAQDWGGQGAQDWSGGSSAWQHGDGAGDATMGGAPWRQQQGQQQWYGQNAQNDEIWFEDDRRREKKEKKDKTLTKEEKAHQKRMKAMPTKLHGTNWELPKEMMGLRLVKDRAPMYKWEYPLYDDSRRSYAGFLRSPWNPAQCAHYFNVIKHGTEWLQPTTNKGVMPRKTAWLVKRGCTCAYSYGPFEVPAAEYPPWMVDLLKECMPYCGLNDEAEWPNCCNMNLYDDGGAAVGWHSDDESLFQGKFRDILIVSLSLGVTRSFQLRYNWPESGEEGELSLKLGPGDLMTMEGMTQKHLLHRVPKEGAIHGPRINLTWRWVVKHSPKCPAGRCR